MPAPSESYEWASNANYAAGEEVGNPTKVTPPTAQAEDGWRPGERPPAQYQNAWQRAVGLWLDWVASFLDPVDDEFIYPATKTRTIYVSPYASVSDGGWNWIPINFATTTANDAQLSLDLTGVLPSGARITTCAALVKPGAARSAGDRIRFRLFRSDIDADFPTSEPGLTTVGDDEDDGGILRQEIPLTGLSEVVDRSEHLYLAVVDAGNDAATNPDRVYGLRVVFEDPGPRNF